MSDANRNRLARFRVSLEILIDALAIPEGTVIRGMEINRIMGEIIMTVESPALEEVPEGQPIPEITPIIRADYEKKPSKWLTFDFNQGGEPGDE